MTPARISRRARYAAAALLLAVAPAFADVADSARAFLAAQGYEILSVEQTWLGRVRIEAEKAGVRRELVMDRTTGEILRDRIEPVAPDAAVEGHRSFIDRVLDALDADDGAEGEEAAGDGADGGARDADRPGRASDGGGSESDDADHDHGADSDGDNDD